MRAGAGGASTTIWGARYPNSEILTTDDFRGAIEASEFFRGRRLEVEDLSDALKLVVSDKFDEIRRATGPSRTMDKRRSARLSRRLARLSRRSAVTLLRREPVVFWLARRLAILPRRDVSLSDMIDCLRREARRGEIPSGTARAIGKAPMRRFSTLMAASCGFVAAEKSGVDMDRLSTGRGRVAPAGTPSLRGGDSYCDDARGNRGRTRSRRIKDGEAGRGGVDMKR